MDNVPPINAASCTPRGNALSPTMIAITAPTAAPADTPTVAGSASGLRNTPCIITPATARLEPTSIASTTRGSRTCQNTLWATASSASPFGPVPMMRSRSGKAIRNAPNASERSVVASNSANRNIPTAKMLVRRAMVMCRCCTCREVLPVV